MNVANSAVVTIGHFIDGRRVEPDPDARRSPVFNPATGAVSGEVLLGDAGVNIAEYHQARLAQGGEALAAVSVDGSIDGSVRERLLSLPDVQNATIVNFREG